MDAIKYGGQPAKLNMQKNLQPTYATKVTELRSNGLTSLGVIKQKKTFVDPKLNKETFLYLINQGISFDKEILLDEKFYTTELKNINLFNFMIGADPAQIQEVYEYGLLRSVYISPNLKEIQFFHEELKKAIKHFRTHCAKKPDAEIYLKIKSTLPVFGESTTNPYHLIKIGISNGARIKASKTKTSRTTETSVAVKESMALIIKDIDSIKSEEKLFINYQDHHVLLYSKGAKPLEDKGVKVFKSFGDKIQKSYQQQQVAQVGESSTSTRSSIIELETSSMTNKNLETKSSKSI